MTCETTIVDDQLTVTVTGDPEKLKQIAQDVRAIVATYRERVPQVVPVMQSDMPCAGCPD